MFGSKITGRGFASTTLAVAAVFATTFGSVAQAQSLSCELRAAKRGNVTVLEAVVGGKGAGSYRISVSGKGGDTDQSGAFNADGRTTVGTMTVGSPGPFNAVLTARSANGQCSARATGSN